MAAESLALLQGLKLRLSNNFLHIDIEVDSMILLQIIQREVQIPWAISYERLGRFFKCSMLWTSLSLTCIERIIKLLISWLILVVMLVGLLCLIDFLFPENWEVLFKWIMVGCRIWGRRKCNLFLLFFLNEILGALPSLRLKKRKENWLT